MTFDGAFDKFEEFRHKIQGHFSQTGAAYLFAQSFQKAYLKDETACYINFLDDVHYESQVVKDVEVLYGALLSACHVGVAKATLAKYSKTQDGIRVWIAMSKKYSASGNKNTRIMQLENMIATPFHRHYKGGLIK